MKLRQITKRKESLTETYKHLLKFELKYKDERKRSETFLMFWRIYFRNLAPLLSEKSRNEKIDLINLIYANAIMKTAEMWASKEDDYSIFVSSSLLQYLDMQIAFLKNGGIHQIEN